MAAAATVTLVSGDNGTDHRREREGEREERVGWLRRHGEIEEWVDRKDVMDQFPGGRECTNIQTQLLWLDQYSSILSVCIGKLPFRPETTRIMKSSLHLFIVAIRQLR